MSDRVRTFLVPPRRASFIWCDAANCATMSGTAQLTRAVFRNMISSFSGGLGRSSTGAALGADPCWEARPVYRFRHHGRSPQRRGESEFYPTLTILTILSISGPTDLSV
eukprot:6205180-Pleurochrysis_carterae.AAC.1